MNGLEYRGEAALGQITGVNEGDHTFSLRIVNYNRADSYGSVWEPGVFADSLRSKLPSACWAHDWTRIIGSLKEHDERSDGLDGLVKFADFDHVPDARMAWSLLKDGHLQNTSFGFKRFDGGWRDTRAAQNKLPGEKERMSRCRLDEVSPVLVGSVPGAGVMRVRSEATGGTVSIADASELLVNMRAGKITLREALAALESRFDPDKDGDDDSNDPTDANDPKVADPSGQGKNHAFVPSGADMDGDECATCGKPDAASVHDGHRAADVEIREPDWRVIEDAFALMRADRLISAETFAETRVENHSASLERLVAYWAHGKGAAKIGWGSSGDFRRCEVQLGKYVPPDEVAGFCARLHKDATGAVPGHAPGELAAKK